MPEYEADFYGWANEQAALLLRAGRLSDADIANIAEEIESMGRSEKRELVNRLAVLLQHLLKWQAQPDRRVRTWRVTIEDQRDQLRIHLRDNPSLRSRLDETYGDAFRLAVRAAQVETDLDRSRFPAANPWPVERAMDDGFYPD